MLKRTIAIFVLLAGLLAGCASGGAGIIEAKAYDPPSIYTSISCIDTCVPIIVHKPADYDFLLNYEGDRYWVDVTRLDYAAFEEGEWFDNRNAEKIKQDREKRGLDN